MGQVERLYKEVAELLKEQGATLATAESCTGGRIASLLTKVAGASEWYRGGVVAYTREAKVHVLGVPEEELSDGLVSERCAIAMARAAADCFGADFALSTTGVCGPSSSEGVLPCGAWIACVSGGQSKAFFFQAPDQGRQQNIDAVVVAALQLLLQTLRTKR